MFGQRRVPTGPIPNSFSSVSDVEVLQLIEKMPEQSSPRDILRVSLLKRCADVFAPVVTRVANLSLLEGCFSSGFKMAKVSPFLKPGTGLHGSSKLSTNFKFVDGVQIGRTPGTSQTASTCVG